MAKEVINKYAPQVTLIGSGNVLSAGRLTASTATIVCGTAQTANYPYADFVLTGAVTGALANSTHVVLLYRRDMDIDGTTDQTVPAGAEAPNNILRHVYVGEFVLPNFSASANFCMSCPDVPLSPDCQFFVEPRFNALSAGYTLKMTPKTQVPKP